MKQIALSLLYISAFTLSAIAQDTGAADATKAPEGATTGAATGGVIDNQLEVKAHEAAPFG